MDLLIILHVVLALLRLSCCTSCKASSATIAYVFSCPTRKKDWDSAAQKKNCSAAEHNCTTTGNFVYHCLPNSEQNRLLEVCSSPEVISFPVCAEFNEEENRIIENHLSDCSIYSDPCPTRYISTEAYKYPGCFNVTQQTTLRVTTVSDEITSFKHPSADERNQDSSGNGTKSTPSISFNSKHPQLLLSFIIAFGILVPVISFILVACSFSTKLSENISIPQTTNDLSEPVQKALLGIPSLDSAE
ncbi:uncharacterized protein LOC133203921 [Saccostrea echinata]|uniref:uncharacterized protein LOC133203921 n=1 Tax=Saccostrea echinata TaxID=191078 RepID=UPI002A82124F|nr:uncharacterized protein LOC133203921 [Saccostrea echinata]XP_061195701.1 uncharacterized protein LOC133203921 [Saccostrea echinata]